LVATVQKRPDLPRVKVKREQAAAAVQIEQEELEKVKSAGLQEIEVNGVRILLNKRTSVTQ
jgi:hypothetical protein